MISTIYSGNILTELNAQNKYILLVASSKAITEKWPDMAPPTKEARRAIEVEMYNMGKLTFSLRLQMVRTYEHEYYIERKDLVLLLLSS